MKNQKEKSIKCSKCGTEFQGSFCHECGTPAEKDKSSKKAKVKKGCLITFLIPFALFALLIIIGIFLPDAPKTEPVNNSTASAESVSTNDSMTANPTETSTEDVTEPSQELSESNSNSDESNNTTDNTNTVIKDSSTTTTKKNTQNTTTTTKKNTQNSTPTTTKKSTQNNTTTTTKNNAQNNVGSGTYVLNTNTKKIHKQTCSQVKKIDSSNKSVVNLTQSGLQGYLNNGYTYCGHCFK